METIYDLLYKSKYRDISREIWKQLFNDTLDVIKYLKCYKHSIGKFEACRIYKLRNTSIRKYFGLSGSYINDSISIDKDIQKIHLIATGYKTGWIMFDPNDNKKIIDYSC